MTIIHLALGLALSIAIAEPVSAEDRVELRIGAHPSIDSSDHSPALVSLLQQKISTIPQEVGAKPELEAYILRHAAFTNNDFSSVSSDLLAVWETNTSVLALVYGTQFAGTPIYQSTFYLGPKIDGFAVDRATVNS